MAGTSNRRTGQGKRNQAPPAGPGMRRPAPPEAFGKPERAIWNRIVNACPPDYLTPECHPLLGRLCVLIAMSEQLEAKWRAGALEKRDLRTYLDVSRQVGNVTTKLRLTPQSRFNRFEASTHMKNRVTYRPWEDVVDDEGPKLRVVAPDE